MKLTSLLLKKNIFFILSVTLFSLSLAFMLSMIGLFGISSPIHKTSLGFIYIGNVEEKNLEQTISVAINDWKEDVVYQILYQNETYSININDFELNLSKTINEIKKNQNNSVFFELSSSNQITFLNELSSTFSNEIIMTINHTKLFEDIISDLSKLLIKSTYSLKDYMQVDDYIVLSEFTLTNIKHSDVSQILATLPNINILEKSRFSILEHTKDLNLDNQQLSIIASGILPLIRNVSFSNIYYYAYPTLQSWGNYGANVRILRINEFDLSFLNSFHQTYQIQISEINSTTLKFELLGFSNLKQISSYSEIFNTINYQTIYITNELIDSSTPGVIIIEEDDEYITYGLLEQQGEIGIIINFYRTITNMDLSILTVIIAQEIYYPKNEVYLINTVEKAGG